MQNPTPIAASTMENASTASIRLKTFRFPWRPSSLLSFSPQQCTEPSVDIRKLCLLLDLILATRQGSIESNELMDVT